MNKRRRIDESMKWDDLAITLISGSAADIQRDVDELKTALIELAQQTGTNQTIITPHKGLALFRISHEFKRFLEACERYDITVSIHPLDRSDRNCNTLIRLERIDNSIHLTFTESVL